MGLQHAGEEGKVIDILDVNTDICLWTCIALQDIHKVFMTLSVSGKR